MNRGELAAPDPCPINAPVLLNSMVLKLPFQRWNILISSAPNVSKLVDGVPLP